MNYVWAVFLNMAGQFWALKKSARSGIRSRLQSAATGTELPCGRGILVPADSVIISDGMKTLTFPRSLFANPSRGLFYHYLRKDISGPRSEGLWSTYHVLNNRTSHQKPSILLQVLMLDQCYCRTAHNHRWMSILDRTVVGRSRFPSRKSNARSIGQSLGPHLVGTSVRTPWMMSRVLQSIVVGFGLFPYGHSTLPDNSHR